MVETMQTYILMHREIPVAEIRLDSETTSVSAVQEIINPAHVPVGIPVKKGKIDRAALNPCKPCRPAPCVGGTAHQFPAGVVGEMPGAFPVGSVLDLPRR